jgi:hypothetical protein
MIVSNLGQWPRVLMQRLFYEALCNGTQTHKTGAKTLKAYDGLGMFSTVHKCSSKNPKVTTTYSNDLEITQKEGEAGWYKFRDKLNDIKAWDGLVRVHAEANGFRVIVSNYAHALWWYRFVTGGPTPQGNWLQPLEIPNVGTVGIMLARLGDVTLIVDPELATYATDSQDEFAYVRPNNGGDNKPFVLRYGGTVGLVIDKREEYNCEFAGVRSWLEFGILDPRQLIRLKVKK